MRSLPCVALRRTMDSKDVAPLIPNVGTISHKSCPAGNRTTLPRTFSPTHSNHRCLPMFRVLKSKRLAGYVVRMGRGRANRSLVGKPEVETTWKNQA